MDAGGIRLAAPRKGGDIRFYPGKGSPPVDDLPEGPRGDIVFCDAGGGEFLKLAGDGQVYVRGEKVVNNLAVYAGFRAWLRFVGVNVSVLNPREVTDG